MHNCKSMKDQLAQLVLGESNGRLDAAMLEISDCVNCREELAAIQSALHVSGQALRTPVVEENFWPGYDARLRAKLANTSSETATPSNQVVSSQPWRALKSFATSSIRLPVPAALALLLVVGVTAGVVAKRGASKTNTPTAGLVHEVQRVEVPVVKEKIVTRVLYVERSRRQQAQRGGSNPIMLNGVASARTQKPALSLIGFKPTDQVKLTIIKGKYQDEK